MVENLFWKILRFHMEHEYLQIDHFLAIVRSGKLKKKTTPKTKCKREPTKNEEELALVFARFCWSLLFVILSFCCDIFAVKHIFALYLRLLAIEMS